MSIHTVITAASPDAAAFSGMKYGWSNETKELINRTLKQVPSKTEEESIFLAVWSEGSFQQPPKFLVAYVKLEDTGLSSYHVRVDLTK